jgi:hypothetical protein
MSLPPIHWYHSRADLQRSNRYRKKKIHDLLQKGSRFFSHRSKDSRFTQGSEQTDAPGEEGKRIFPNMKDSGFN